MSQQLKDLALVTLTPSAWEESFKDSFLPVGQVGVIVGYPNGVVGVFSRSKEYPYSYVARQAVDPLGKAFRPFCKRSPSNRRAFDRALDRFETGDLIPQSVQLPVGYGMTSSSDDISLESLALASGAEAPEALEAALLGSIKLMAPYRMAPCAILEDSVLAEPARIYEFVGELLDSDGTPKPQVVTRASLEAAGLGLEELYKFFQPNRTRLPRQPVSK